MKSGNKLMTSAMSAPDRKYEAQEALRTLKRADEIQRDRGLMKVVKCCARDEMKALAKVTGGKKK